MHKMRSEHNKKKMRRRKKIPHKFADENADPEKGNEQQSITYTVEELIEMAEGFMDRFEYESAQGVIHRALEINADHPRILELAASLLIEGGNREGAMQCLGRAITVSPSTGYRKYFSMAQLLEGREALEMYVKGIDLLTKEVHQANEEQVAAACAPLEGETSKTARLQKELSTVYISVSELWMTDLCDEDDAEVECERAITNAKQADPTNAEALQQMANFLLIKGEMEGARSAMMESIEHWLPQLRSAADGKDDAEVEDPVEICSLSVPSRLTAAKNLIELEEWDLSAEILDLIIHEDEDITEPWYLQGWLNYLRGEDFKGNARFYLRKAMEVAQKNNFDDEDVLAHIRQLQEELGPGKEEDESDEDVDEDIDSEASTDDEEGS